MDTPLDSAPKTPRITGTMVNYYKICQRKLWLFCHDVQMEQESDTVANGKLIDETSYPDEKHGVEIQDTIVLDFLKVRDGVIHEVKKSDAMEDAHLWQLKYYLYFLKTLGMSGLRGEIDYPKLKRKVEVSLEPEDEAELQKMLAEIYRISKSEEIPGTINKQFCKKCAYFEFCWT
jgi:CRISPR-associated exonuclease Cas4